jgi:hypothetical protein
MRKVVLAFVLGSLLLSCARNEDIAQFEIIDSHGKIYSSVDITNKIKKEYQLDNSPKMILLLTNSLENSVFEQQMNIIEELNAEDYEYIQVVGSANARNKSGYSIKSEDAEALLSKADFQIHIYNEDGGLIASSGKVMNKHHLIVHLTKRSSGR